MHRFRKTQEIAQFNNNFLLHYEITPTHSMLGLKNRSGCTPALIPLFEAALHLHTVIEISDKNPSNFQI